MAHLNHDVPKVGAASAHLLALIQPNLGLELRNRIRKALFDIYNDQAEDPAVRAAAALGLAAFDDADEDLRNRLCCGTHEDEPFVVRLAALQGLRRHWKASLTPRAQSFTNSLSARTVEKALLQFPWDPGNPEDYWDGEDYRDH